MTATSENGKKILEDFAPKIIRWSRCGCDSTVMILKQSNYYFFYSNDELVFGLYKEPLKYKWKILPAKHEPIYSINPVDINAGLNIIQAYFDWDYVKKTLEKLNAEHS